MSSLTFDTLKFANRLKKAGIAPVHAEAEAEALAEIFETNLSELATKGDLEKLAASLRQDLAHLKFELLKWVIGLGIAQTSLLIALKLFT